MEIKDTTEKKRLQEYIATIQNIAENTSALGSEQESFLESVRGLKQSLESGVYRVAVVGEFSTGKSTFINALMGEKILYASNKEARNTELYEQEKADHDISLKGQMLSQDEYLKRSGFGVFLAELFDFLQEDTRQKNLLTDIKDKFSILINSLLEELQKEQDGLSDNRKEKYNSNKKNIELAQEARRKTYNAIIRNIKDMLNKTLEDLEEEYKSYYPITQTERIYINGLFKQIEDLSDDNLQKCIQNTKKEIEQIIKKKESRINEIIKGISDEYIKKVFQDTILSTYKLEKLYSDIKIPTNRYHIDLKDKEDRDISFEDDNIKFLKDRVGEIQQSIEQNLSEKNKFSEEIKKLENKIEQQKRKSDLRYRKGLGELGTRPEPKQKYKTIKVKKFFFIKEERELIEDINKIIGSEEFFYIIENDNYKREIHEMLEKLQENKCIVGRSGNQLRKMKEKVNHLNAKYERDYLLYKQRIQKNIKTDEQDEKSQFIKERILSKKMFNIFCNVKWDFEN